MRRMIVVLAVTVVLAVLLVLGGGLFALAQEAPTAPQCNWYLNWYSANPDRAWWEYWCWWPGWGWEYVFWVWD